MLPFRPLSIASFLGDQAADMKHERQQQLQKRISGAFTTMRGPLLEADTADANGVKDIIKTEIQRGSNSKGIKLALYAAYGHSQLLPPPAALIQATINLRSAILNRAIELRQRCPSTYHVRKMVEHSRVVEEIRNVVGHQQRLSPEHREHDSIMTALHVFCVTKDVVSSVFARSKIFLTVLPILAVAIHRMQHPQIHWREWGIKVARYRSYLWACKRAAASRASLLTGLGKLSAELRLKVFGHLVPQILPGASWTGDEDGLADAIHAMLSALQEIKVCTSRTASDPRLLRRSRPIPNAIVAGFMEEIEEAVISSGFIRFPAQFPARTETRLPYPSFLEPRRHLIKRLHLHTIMKHSATACYPRELFQLQDNVPKLKTWIPNLESLKLDIVYKGGSHHRRTFQARLPRRDETTMLEELMTLVVQMKELDVKERIVRFLSDEAARNWEQEQNDDSKMEKTTSAVLKDATKMEVYDIAAGMSIGDSVSFLV